MILVHGTFGLDSTWYRPGGKFYKTLEQHATTLNQKLVPFTWSGKLSDKARIQAAESLAALILSYPKDEPIILIGHSHGGNVIILASRLLNDPVPRLKDTDENIPPALDLLLDNTLTRTLEDSLARMLRKAYRSIKRLRSLRTGTAHTPYLIDRAYLLATPVDSKHYLPDMDIIGNLYHLYSETDLIQTVFGVHERLFAKQDRVVNLRVTVEKQAKGIYDPSHSGLHSALIASWLLWIPESLTGKQLAHFVSFTDTENGMIHFDKDGIPSYQLASLPAEIQA